MAYTMYFPEEMFNVNLALTLSIILVLAAVIVYLLLRKPSGRRRPE